MKAVIYQDFARPLQLQNVQDPMPSAGGVVIRVEACGVCRSDWHAWMGHDPTIGLPHVPGHELAGVVLEVGPQVRRWTPGDRVTLPFCCGCGHCPPCRRGDTHICDNEFQPGFTAWGAFAEYLAVPYADINLVRLPESLGFVEAAALGCRFMTAFWGVASKGRLAPGEWLVVFGCGGVGLSCIMIGAALGAAVVAVDLDDAKLELARELGANITLNAERQDSVTAIREVTGGGAHVSVDALGSTTTCNNAIRSLRKRGRHVQIGLLLAQHRSPPLPMTRVIAMELEILGSHGMPAWRYPALLEAVTVGRLTPGKLVKRRIPLEEAPAELEAMGRFAQQGVTVIDHFR